MIKVKAQKLFHILVLYVKTGLFTKLSESQKQNRQEMDIFELPKELELKHISTTNPYLKERAAEEFWTFLEQEVSSWEHDKMKENERKVLEAVKNFNGKL